MSVLSYGSGEVPSRLRSIVTGDEVVVFRDGAADGRTGVCTDGTPLYGLESVSMRTRDAVWNKDQRSVVSQANCGDGRNAEAAFVFDYRTIGMLPAPVAAQFQAAPASALDAARAAGDEHPEYTETIDGDGYHVVTRVTAGGDEVTTWYLDAEMGFNAVRVEQVVRGRPTRSTSISYEFVTDVWVPVRVAYLNAEGAVTSVTELIYEAVNNAEVPERLTPEMIGVYCGSPVNLRDNQRTDVGEQVFWAGDRFVPISEFESLEKAGVLVRDPRVDAASTARMNELAARAVDGKLPGTTQGLYGTPFEPLATIEEHWRSFASRTSPAEYTTRLEQLRKKTRAAMAPPPLDPWDEYVEQFIRDYRLDAEQSQKCALLLDQAKQRRQSHMQRHRDRLASLVKAGAGSVNEMARAVESLRAVLEPVDRIFEQLKKRLLTIPTRQQLSSAQERAAQNKPTSVSRTTTRPANRP
ncbi:MAG: hypothetical protein IT450_14460 [Phycisphaerales bacterium]|nr:hypothetical protein [Phycisphaerales bacterium]